SRTESTSLRGSALINRKPNCSIWRNVKMSMQPSAWISGAARSGVGRRAHGCIVHTQIIAALTGGRSHDILGAIIDGMPVCNRIRRIAQATWDIVRNDIRIRSRTDGLVIGASIWWRSTGRVPYVAVVQTGRCAVG